MSLLGGITMNKVFDNKIKAYYYLFILNLIFYALYRLFKGYCKESWQITEWLINYQGGFVRRGLPGELLFSLNKYTGISTYVVILVISVSSYILLVLFIYNSFKTSGYPIIILPFVYFLGGPIINDFLIRKDVLLILIFIAAVRLLNNINIKALHLAGFLY
jgi:hypothetical protein